MEAEQEPEGPISLLYTKRNTFKKDNKKIVNLCSEGPVSTDYFL